MAGGHSIDSVEPIYGLVAIGIVNPAHLKRNSGAKPGDKLILGKPLGVGVYSAALKKDQLLASDYQAMVATTTQLNTPGPVLACLDGVHAVTDVTGFGLAGHLLEVCKGSGLRATVNYADLPLLARTREFIQAGLMTGASGRNWASYGDKVSLAAGLDAAAQHYFGRSAGDLNVGQAAMLAGNAWSVSTGGAAVLPQRAALRPD